MCEISAAAGSRRPIRAYLTMALGHRGCTAGADAGQGERVALPPEDEAPNSEAVGQTAAAAA